MAGNGRSAKGTARREEILTTAMRELAANGYGGTSLRAIGRAMGVEPAHILYYFETREALLEAVIDRWDLDAWEGPHGPRPADALDAYEGTIRHNLEIPGVVHLCLAFAAEAAEPTHRSHAYFSRRFARVLAFLTAAIREEQRLGSISADLHPESEARALIAIADGMQLQALVDPLVDAPGAVALAIARLRSPSAR